MGRCNFYLSQRTFISISGALLIRLARDHCFATIYPLRGRGSAPSPLGKAMVLIASEVGWGDVTDKSEFESLSRSHYNQPQKRLRQCLPPGWKEQLRAAADRIAVEGARVIMKLGRILMMSVGEKALFYNRFGRSVRYAGSFHRKRSPSLSEGGIWCAASCSFCGLNIANSFKQTQIYRSLCRSF